jgi:hypothetical protein
LEYSGCRGVCSCIYSIGSSKSEVFLEVGAFPPSPPRAVISVPPADEKATLLLPPAAPLLVPPAPIVTAQPVVEVKVT